MVKMRDTRGKPPELPSTHSSDETITTKVDEYAKETATYYKTFR